jgi:hypothetical protein
MSEVRTPSKDEIIIRQSQMQRAIEIYTLTGKKPSLKQICRLSQILTEFIFTWDYESDSIKKFDNYLEGTTEKKLIDSLTKK